MCICRHPFLDICLLFYYIEIHLGFPLNMPLDYILYIPEKMDGQLRGTKFFFLLAVKRRPWKQLIDYSHVFISFFSGTLGE